MQMYSLDFRKKIFKIKEKENLTFEQTSKRFDVSIRTLFSWQERMEPILKRNKPATKIDMDKLKEDVEKNPDAYQYERAEQFGVTAWAIGQALKRLKISYKKNSVSPKSGRRKKK